MQLISITITTVDQDHEGNWKKNKRETAIGIKHIYQEASITCRGTYMCTFTWVYASGM